MRLYSYLYSFFQKPSQPYFFLRALSYLYKEHRLALAAGVLLSIVIVSAQLIAAPMPDAGASKIYNATPSGSTFNANYTVTAGTNQILMVVVECETCSAPTLVTYNGVSLTSALNETSANQNVWTYYIVNPPTGVAHSVAVTLGGAYYSPMAMFAYSYSGVNQTVPLGNVGGSITTPSMSGGVNNVTLGFTPSTPTSTVLEESYEKQPGGAAMSLDHGSVRFTSNNVSGNSPGDYSFGDWSPSTLAAQTFKYTWTLGATNSGTSTMVGAIELMPAIVSTPTCTSTPTSTPTCTSTSTSTSTMTPTCTMTPTSTNTTVSTPTFSPTVTPCMALTKTANVGSATIGDTITFCFLWSNDSSGTVTMSIWDTVSSFLTYVGCNTGCTQGGSLVKWSFSATAGSSGTVCFWGTVNGYPFMPELMTAPVVQARREDLEFLFGLLPQGGAKL